MTRNRERFVRGTGSTRFPRRSTPYIGYALGSSALSLISFALFLSFFPFFRLFSPTVQVGAQEYVPTYLPTYEGRYDVRRFSRRPYATLLFSGGQIISGPRRRQQRLRRRCALDAHLLHAVAGGPSITLRPGSCTEEVASSRTYLEPPRRIKARPTGLRLQRSRRAATCSTWTAAGPHCSPPRIAIAFPSRVTLPLRAGRLSISFSRFLSSWVCR